MYRRYGPIVAEENPGRGVLVHLFCADDIRTMYQHEGKVPYRTGLRPFKAYHRAKPENFPNVGILNIQGEEWRRLRGALQAATMRPKTVQAYASALAKIADDTVALIAALRDEKGEVDDCDEIMQRWSLQAAVAVALNRRLGLLQHPLPKDSDGSVILRSTGRLMGIVDDLMVKTSNMASFSIYRLAAHPEAQEKARKEALSFDKAPDDDTPVDLPYIQACIRETLRFHPAVPGVDRKLDHDVVMSGYRIPANTEMRTVLSVAGRMEEHFKHADQFVPERWLRRKEKEADKNPGEAWNFHPFASVPFSKGPRMCIGQRISELELSILLAKVLKRYKIENHHGDIGSYARFMTRPDRPVKLRFVELGESI
ncbi:putative cytochrome P450 301a1, mitochondrial [Haemaphysalis longicornis]